jgi:hypothetical protein
LAHGVQVDLGRPVRGALAPRHVQQPVDVAADLARLDTDAADERSRSTSVRACGGHARGHVGGLDAAHRSR